MSQLNKWAGVLALVAIVIAIGGYAYPKIQTIVQDNLGATGTRFPNGISADSTSPSVGQIRGTTLTITGASTLTATTTVTSDYWSVGGIDYASVQQSFTAATTTMCSIENPFGAATTTILSYIAQITVGTSTAANIDVATSTTAFATSTPALIFNHVIASGAQDTIVWLPGIATSTITLDKVLSGRADGTSNFTLGPSEFLNIKTGVGLAGYTWTGTCSVTVMKP